MIRNLRCCPKATSKRTFLEYASFVLNPPFPPPHCTTAGDISALAGAPIEVLVLYNCKNLTGTLFLSGCSNLVMLPQGNNFKLAFQECSSFLLTPSLQHTTVGDISVLKDMPITHLYLDYCEDLTGEWVRIS